MPPSTRKDFTEGRRHRHRIAPIVATLPALVLAVALGLLLWIRPGVRVEFVLAWDLLLAGDPEPLRQWLLDFGAWAPVISGLLQIASSLIPPLPSFMLGIVNAMLYGAWKGGLLTFVTALIAAASCFGLARFVGRPGVERIASERNLRKVDDFMERKGILAVFLARLIPFINPDVASYAAGLTRIGWLPFLLAMGAGAIPATIFYSVIGALAIESTGWVIVLVALSTVVPLIIIWAIWRKQGEPRADRGEQSDTGA